MIFDDYMDSVEFLWLISDEMRVIEHNFAVVSGDLLKPIAVELPDDRLKKFGLEVSPHHIPDEIELVFNE